MTVETSAAEPPWWERIPLIREGWRGSKNPPDTKNYGLLEREQDERALWNSQGTGECEEPTEKTKGRAGEVP